MALSLTPTRISTRIGIVIAVIAGICTLGMGYILTHSLNDVLVEAQVRDLDSGAIMQQLALSRTLESASENLQFLTGLRSTRRLVRALSHAGVDPEEGVGLGPASELTQDSYRQLLVTKPEFLAVHLYSLEQGGREELRVLRTAGAIAALPRTSLVPHATIPPFPAVAPEHPDGGTTVIATRGAGAPVHAGADLIATIWVPLYNRGSLAGALSVDMDLKEVLERMEATVPATWVFAVTDDGGRIYYAKNTLADKDEGPRAPLRITDVYPQLRGLFAGGGQGVVQEDVASRSRGGDLLAARRVALGPRAQDGGLTVILAAKYRGIVEAAEPVHLQALTLGLGSILLAAIITGLSARYYLRPLREIVAGVRRFADGDPSPPLPTRSRDELGVVARALRGMIRDVSAKTRALQASEMRYRRILATAQEGIWMVDNEGRTTWCNQRLAQMMGSSPDLLNGVSLYARVHPDWEAAARNAVVRAQVSGSERVECALLAESGESLWCELAVAPLMDGIGIREGTLLMVWDLTARRRAEQELERVARMRELILSAAGDGIFGFDADLRFTFVNPAASAMLGYPASQLLGESLHRIHPASADGASAVDCRICLRAGAGQESQGIQVFRHADGHSFPAEFVSTPLGHGRLAGGVVVFKDVTEREELQRMKEEFVSTVSHELRTPMTSILGSLRLVLGGAAGDLTADMNELLTIALNNGERLVRIINDILDVEKLESGKMALTLAPVQVGDLLVRSLDAMRPLAQQAAVGLEMEPAPRGVRVYADEDRLVQVVTNLIANAVKFSPRDAEVRLAARVEGDVVRVQVADQGPGIPAEFRGRIFQKFAQANGSDRRASGGTGLGLSICKSIVEQHGGHIGFDSIPGHGATFYFELPVMRRSATMGDLDRPESLSS